MVRLTKYEQTEISTSRMFICIIPEGGLEGTKGEKQLEFAASIGKPVLYWVPTGRIVDIPEYPGVVVRGDVEEVKQAIEEFFESKGPFKLADGGY